jgi:hypothetical protein
MKTLLQYFDDLTPLATDTTAAAILEVDAMRKMKITTQVSLDETEGLFNTVDDRWSRRAKHPLSQTELMNAADISEFSKGDTAVYEGRYVEVRIPLGPNGTSGVMLEGHLKMVNRSKLSKIEEGVMGMMKPLGPLNRMMQLAGLEHSSPVLEADDAVEEVQPIEEADAAGTMFDNLYQANLNNPIYKNNPAAARVATIGEVLAGMQSMIAELPTDLPGNISTQLKAVPGIGANLIKTASAMTKPSTAAPAAGATA